MHRALLALCLTLSGCALLPEGSEVGLWIRLGPDQNRSMAWSWSDIAPDPAWRCPPAAERGRDPGVPGWMKCPGE
jgi:hypothetical protein